jgi:hypothetical protein
MIPHKTMAATVKLPMPLIGREEGIVVGSAPLPVFIDTKDSRLGEAVGFLVGLGEGWLGEAVGFLVGLHGRSTFEIIKQLIKQLATHSTRNKALTF